MPELHETFETRDIDQLIRRKLADFQRRYPCKSVMLYIEGEPVAVPTPNGETPHQALMDVLSGLTRALSSWAEVYIQDDDGTVFQVDVGYELSVYPKRERRYEELQSELQSDGHAPPCCYANPDNGPGAALYAAYNCGGPIERQGKNYKGENCPMWDDLPQSVRDKWNKAAQVAS